MNVHDTFCETLRLLGLNPHFILMDSATEKPVTDLTPKQWEELNKVATWVDQPQASMSLKGATCVCGHHFVIHWLTSQDEGGELWCMYCECKEFVDDGRRE